MSDFQPTPTAPGSRFRAISAPVTAAAFLVSATLMQAAAKIPTEATYDEYLDNLYQEYSFFTISNLWLLIAAAMVFMMHLGFATLEAGLNRSKNTVNILYKNLFVISIGLISYAFIGFNTMYPGETFNGFFKLGFWFGAHPDTFLDTMTSKAGVNYTYWTDFLFQGMFAATAATIVSGAVAERIKLGSFMIFATILVGFAYPVAGSWTWGGGGWLGRNGFTDFAGSSVVHAFGGYAALACIILLGPRKGKYDAEGKARPIIGHSMPLATVGVFLLWFGWFGFNGGSVLDATPELVGRVLVMTNLSAAAGILGAMVTCQILLKKPDLSMALNGALAGLVGITAGANSIEPHWALVVGLISGALVVASILFFEKIKIDDPVGAVSVHGVCGTWGTLCVGLFGEGKILWQIYGCLTYAVFSFAFAFVVFAALKFTIGVRVTEEEEDEGLDIAEHGQEAYSELTSAR